MSVVSGLRNISISKKLYTGFGVVLLLVAIACALSVMRFSEITRIYDKTNLIYNINIEVFQAKINRLKYFYSGDDKVRTAPVGVIALHDKKETAFEQKHVRDLRELTSGSALALENAQMLFNLQQPPVSDQSVVESKLEFIRGRGAHVLS